MTPEQIIENRKKWAAALRSGDWKQCRNAYGAPGGFCCLGVLNAVVHGRSHGPGPASDLGAFVSARSAANLSDGQVYGFIDANDNDGKSFLEIADMVDALPAPR